MISSSHRSLSVFKSVRYFSLVLKISWYLCGFRYFPFRLINSDFLAAVCRFETWKHSKKSSLDELAAPRRIKHKFEFNLPTVSVQISGVGSNLQVGAQCRRRPIFFDVPPLLSCASHMRPGHNDCLLPTERQFLLKCPLVSALQSAHLLVKSGGGQ